MCSCLAKSERIGSTKIVSAMFTPYLLYQSWAPRPPKAAANAVRRKKGMRTTTQTETAKTNRTNKQIPL